jgi:hypothetical protein
MLRTFSAAIASFVIVTISVTVSVATCLAAEAPAAPPQVDRIEGQTIYFKGDSAPKPLKTELYDLALVGTMKPPADATGSDAIPYFLFSANPCTDCNTEKALYLIRPLSKTQITAFVYPGKVTDPKTHQVVLESRAFVGQCLAGAEGSDQYVVFQKERVDHKHGFKIETSVFEAVASPDYLREKLIERNFPRLTRTLAFVKAKRCAEIPGHNRVMPLKPKGVDWHNLKQEEEDDEDDAESGATSSAGTSSTGTSAGTSAGAPTGASTSTTTGPAAGSAAPDAAHHAAAPATTPAK